jgi:hypothetical protein
MSIYEILMMICWGTAWPFAIYKSYKSQSNAGKSLIFVLIALFGYICGILHKIFYNCDYVILLYLINFVLILTDLCLYFRNYWKAKEKMRQAK